eukprot:1481777-Prymnesium_polylepis.1
MTVDASELNAPVPSASTNLRTAASDSGDDARAPSAAIGILALVVRLRVGWGSAHSPDELRPVGHAAGGACGAWMAVAQGDARRARGVSQRSRRRALTSEHVLRAKVRLALECAAEAAVAARLLRQQRLPPRAPVEHHAAKRADRALAARWR